MVSDAEERDQFMEYLELQGRPDLVTKSALLNRVRRQGFKLSDRQLTFYMSEGLIPPSVRVGSRAGAYPEVVVHLLSWLLYMRRIGVSIDALRELLPVWKFLMRSTSAQGEYITIDVSEFELIARQHIASPDASSAVPATASYVISSLCDCCRRDIRLIDRDGNERSSEDSTTIGFAVAPPLNPEGDDDSVDNNDWMLRTRLSLAVPSPHRVDSTTVRLGRKPGEPWPVDQLSVREATAHADGAKNLDDDRHKEVIDT